MKSSSRGPDIFRTLWHPAISVSVATTAILTLMWLVNRLAGLPAPRTFTVVVVILAPLIEATVGNILYAERAGIGHRVRELVIYLLLVYLFASLFRGGSLTERFSPGPAQVVPALAATGAWLYAFGLHNRLRGREALLRTFSGVQGEHLRHALIDRQHDMALTVRELKGARGIIAGVLGVTLLLAILVATGPFTSSELPANSPAFLLVCLSGVVSSLVAGALNIFADEYAVNSVGLRVPARFQRRRLLAAIAVVAVAFTAAFLLSRRTSLLPLESIVAFFRWFGALFDRESSVPFPQPMQPPAEGPTQYDVLREMLANQGREVPPLWLRLLGQLVRRLAVALMAGAAAFLIFGPLFSAEFRSGLKRIKPGNALRNLWVQFVRTCVVAGRFLRALLRGQLRRHRDSRTTGDPNDDSPSSARATAGRWAPTMLKRRQMDRVVSVFASLTRWGATHGLVYHPSEGARDYLIRLAEFYPEHREPSQVCAVTFWEARYSRHMLPFGRMREYVRAAKRITGAG